MGLLGGPFYSPHEWGVRSITDQLLLLLWKTKVILRGGLDHIVHIAVFFNRV